MITDTHTHLYLDEFLPFPGDAVKRAIDAGVDRMIFPNVDLTTIEPMRRLHCQFPENTFMAIGLHPTEVRESWQEDLAAVKRELDENASEYVAVGEIGIDMYWDKTFKTEQMEVFSRQLAWAYDSGLPVIIHSRDGLDEILEVMDGHQGCIPQGVFHSFGGTVEDVERIRQRGDFYFGINGIVTFKNSRLRDVLPAIGIDRIMLETDSPYLAPVPHRGKRNESAYIVHTAAYIAGCLSLSVEEVSVVTTSNASLLFGI